jgi:predicted PurR-regulated permease PerM
MKMPDPPDRELEKRLSDRLLDVLIRAGLVLVLVLLCYKIFAPFLAMMAWALILAVTLYPLHQKLARKTGGKPGRAATLLVLVCAVAIVAPTVMLVNSLGDSLHTFATHLSNNTLHIPAPPQGVADWPVIGKKLHTFWAQAHSNLPALIERSQPKLGELTTQALGIVAGIGVNLLLFLASFNISGILMAFGESGAQATQEVFARLAGTARGEEFAKLSTATVRAVASGVIGIACIQALLIGLALIIAGIPWAGVLSLVVLVLGIAQVPALVVTLPAIGYIWSGGDYGTGAAIGYTVLLLVTGFADNILKPLMLGRGVDAPMPVVLLGALGGMATNGILGMFIGATLLALGYQIFMGWVAANPDKVRMADERESQAAG